ncbi:unnamed protein product [Urochloa humidicola]
MLALETHYRAAVATSQDKQWTISTWFSTIVRPLLSAQGKTYGVHETSVESTLEIFQMDTPLPNEGLQEPKLIATCTRDKLRSPLSFVECDSEILVIGRNNDIPVPSILVYKLADLVMERYIPVTSIGDKAIFIQERALIASTKAVPTVMGDTITCTRSMKLVQYHLSSGAWLQTMDQCSLLGIELGPCSLIQHIVTCCNRAHWNKGLLISPKKYYAGWTRRVPLRWPIAGFLRHGA